MLDKTKTVLLITGCMQPPQGVTALTISDAEARREQYLECLIWAMQATPFTKIVYCDNSACTLPETLLKQAQKLGKQLEILPFQGNVERTIQAGKGYGEGEIIEYALKYSHLLQEADYFCKLTGRLRVENVKCFFACANQKKAYFWGNGIYSTAIDTRFYGIPKDLYRQYYQNAYKQVCDRENVWLEHCFYDAYCTSKIPAGQIALYPDFRGVSGSMGIQYKLPRWKLYAKNAASALGLYLPKEKA